MRSAAPRMRFSMTFKAEFYSEALGDNGLCAVVYVKARVFSDCVDELDITCNGKVFAPDELCAKDKKAVADLCECWRQQVSDFEDGFAEYLSEMRSSEDDDRGCA